MAGIVVFLWATLGGRRRRTCTPRERRPSWVISAAHYSHVETWRETMERMGPVLAT